MRIKNQIFSKILACDIGIYKVVSEITFVCGIQILQAWVFINFLCAGYEREFDFHTRELKNPIFSGNFDMWYWKFQGCLENYFCLRKSNFTRVSFYLFLGAGYEREFYFHTREIEYQIFSENFGMWLWKLQLWFKKKLPPED